MPDLRYVCLSDVHFGASNSLLTHLDHEGIIDPARPSRTLEALIACLGDLMARYGGRPPTLILNGDILDLALSSTSASSMAFERFLELAFPADGPPLFADHIIYIPGNHDHHLWESSREVQYAADLAQVGVGSSLPDERHATPVFGAPQMPAFYLTALMRRYPRFANAAVVTAYPTFGAVSDDRKRCVLFHHGHYAEALYYLITKVMNVFFPGRRQPATLGAVEQENFSWIDFFWGTLGRSGDAGKDVEVIYDKLQKDDATRALLHTAVASLLAHTKQGRLVDWAEGKALDAVLDALVARVTSAGRNASDVPLSPEVLASLKALVEGPLRNDVLGELGFVPDSLTLIFGHTHKPFEGVEDFTGFQSPVRLVNSGGWVVDSPDASPAEGGAVIFVDADLDVASLRMYNEADRPEDYAVRVAGLEGANPDGLAARLRSLVDPTANPWRAFSEAAAACVKERAQLLIETIRTPS